MKASLLKRFRGRTQTKKNRRSIGATFTLSGEQLENRSLLAADLIFKTTPFDHDNNVNTPIQPFANGFSFQQFGFDDGNALIKDFKSIVANPSGQVNGEFLMQTTLVNFRDDNGIVGVNGGLNVNYEVTLVFRSTVAKDGDGKISLTAPQAGSAFGLEIYYNDIGGTYGGIGADRANDLNGTNFDNGTLILKGDVLKLDQRNLSLGQLNGNFDQFGGNNYLGITTLNIGGDFDINVNVMFVANNHISVREGFPLTAADLDTLDFDFNLVAPFQQVDPSRQFFADGGGANPGFKATLVPDPNIGLVNGQGQDLQLESRSSIALPLVPGSIHGYKCEDIVGNGVCDTSDPPMKGVRFALWTDKDGNGSFDTDGLDNIAGNADDDRLVNTAVSNAQGEFWFEEIVPGHYVVREVGPVSPDIAIPSEVMPSTPSMTYPIDRPFFICAGEEHVWRPGAAMFGQVVGRQIFYNNSAFDPPTNLTPLSDNDPSIATDKVPYLLSNVGAASFSNYTSYLRGINGIIVDIKNGSPNIKKEDFEFHTGNDNTSALWAKAADPSSVQTRDLGGGITRVYIIWPDGAIKNKWLQVVVKANINTRIPQDDIFYFGNQVGEGNGDISGNPGNAHVDGTDSSAVYANLTSIFGTAGITNHYDFDRDNKVDGVDSSIVYANLTPILDPTNPIKFIDFTNGEQPRSEWPREEIVVGDPLKFANFVAGSIHGFKFDDYEGDGVYDPPGAGGPTTGGWDLPFGGIQFQLNGVNGLGGTVGPIVVTSDHGGEFWFTGLKPGRYFVTELQPQWADVMASTPMRSREIIIRSGQEHVWKRGAGMLPAGTLKEEFLIDSQPSATDNRLDTGLMFGNYVKGSIHGFKFEDDNANGTRDPNEVPWKGIKFSLHRSDVNGTQLALVGNPAFTDQNGEFWFTGLVPGWYLVKENLPPDINVEYVPTRPAVRKVFVGSREELVWRSGAAMLAPGALQHEILNRAQPLTFNGADELVFGNYIPGSIHGFKCNDLNGNGTCDTELRDANGNVTRIADPPFAGVTVFLTQKDANNNDVVVSTTTTDAGGEFWFENLRPGTYTAAERAKPIGVVVDTNNVTRVGLVDQGELLNAAGSVAFPNDNVMMSPTNNSPTGLPSTTPNSNIFTVTITSRDEYVWKLGAGNFEKYCFRDNPGLAEQIAEITYPDPAAGRPLLCNGEMSTHTIRANIPMPSDAYHIAELEVVNGYGNASLDNGVANWTSGTYTFSAPDVPGFPQYFNYADLGGHPLTGFGAKFQVTIVAGKLHTFTQTSINTGSLLPSLNYTNIAATGGSGTGLTFNISVNAAGIPTLTPNNLGQNYQVGNVVTIPFTAIGGQTPADNLVLRIDRVQSMFIDLKPTGVAPLDDPDTIGPDANILMSGKAYEVGEMFTITPPGAINGDVLSINTIPISQGFGYGAPGQISPTFTYLNVPVQQAGGMTVDVVIDTNPVSPNFQKVLGVALKNPGVGYSAGQDVTISGLLLDAGNNDTVMIRIVTVGNDNVMLKVVNVGHTTLNVELMEMGDDSPNGGQSSVITANPVVIDSLLGGNATQQVQWTLKLTGTGYDDIISHIVKVDGVPSGVDIFVDGTAVINNFGPQLDIAVNNGTLRQEIVDDRLVFENYIKGSVHGRKFHDRNLDGIFNAGDEVFPGVEFSLADANGNLIAPDYSFSGGIADTANYKWFNGQGQGILAHTPWLPDAVVDHNTPVSHGVGSARSTLLETQTASISVNVFTPFMAGIGFSKRVGTADGGDSLKFYIDDVLTATYTGSAAQSATGDTKFTDAWFDGVNWGWHKFTWTFANDDDGVPADPATAAVSAWIDDLRFTARTDGNGEYWIKDISPGAYKVIERLDLVGQIAGEVMPSFMNVSQWAKTATAPTEFTGDPNTPNDDMLAVHATGVPDDRGWSSAYDDAHHLITPLPVLELTFEKAVFANNVVIDPVPGFSTGVVKIEINDSSNNTWHEVPLNGVLLGMTSFLSNKVRLTVDTDTVWNAFEKVDAVQLNGMMMLSDRTDVTVQSGTEYVWRAGAALLPNPTLRRESAPVAGLDFANLVKGSIHAIKFEDVDADGVYEPTTDVDPNRAGVQSDKPWAGFRFELFARHFKTGEFTVLVDTQISDATGNVWFTGLKPGQDYKLFEKGFTLPHFAGEIMSSTPDEIVISNLGSGREYVWGQGAAMLDANSPSVKSEIIVSGLAFGNYVKGSIHGFKYEDVNGNGVYSIPEGDKPFGGVRFEIVRLSGPNDTVGTPVPGFVNTDKDGEFWFENLVPGYYRVKENLLDNPVMPSNDDSRVFFVGSRDELVWAAGRAKLNMFPNTLKRELIVGSAAGFDFDPEDSGARLDGNGLYYGNFVKGSIHGFKCHDIDADSKCETNNHVIFIIDASDSMLAPITPSFTGVAGTADDIPGDINGDGLANTKLDSEIRAFEALVAEINATAMPNTSTSIGLVVMGEGTAFAGQFNNGLDHFTSPTADVNGVTGLDGPNGIPDIVDRLRIVEVTNILTPDDDTNFEAALELATVLLGEWNSDRHLGNVYMLSDGHVNQGGEGAALQDEVNALLLRASNIVADAIGTDADLDDGLDVIDAQASKLITHQDVINGVHLGVAFNLPEKPTAGVVFTLTGTDGLGNVVGPLSQTTNAGGEFWFTGLAPGNYTVTETIPPGFVSSTGSVWTKTIRSREEYAWRSGAAMLPNGDLRVEIVDSKLTFGNYATGSIHGFKFHDTNGDGIFNPATDSPMSGVSFRLTGPNNYSQTVVSQVFTGEFWFTNLVPGTYVVTELDNPNDDVLPTTHTSTTIYVESGQEHVWRRGAAGNIVLPKYEVLADGDDDPSNDVTYGTFLEFGNTIRGSIHGFKFEDWNGDGLYDSQRITSTETNLTDGIDNNGDGFIDNQFIDILPARPGLQIQRDNPWANFPFSITGDIDGDGDDDTIQLTTNANGEFWQVDLYPGVYIIQERLDLVHPDVRPSTNANGRLPVAVISGQELVWKDGAAMLGPNDPQQEVLTPNLAFGNVYVGSLHGCVFNDLNGNGTQQAGEAVLGGQPVELYRSNVSGQLLGAAIATSTSTFPNGFYGFENLIPGYYAVRTVAAANVQVTTPNPGIFFVHSREELVHRDGAAGLVAGDPQHERNLVSFPENIVGQPLNFVPGTSANTLVGIRQIAGAIAGVAEGSVSGRTSRTAIDQLMAGSTRRRAAEFAPEAPISNRSRGAFVDAAFSSLDGADSALDSFLNDEEDERVFVA